MGSGIKRNLPFVHAVFFGLLCVGACLAFCACGTSAYKLKQERLRTVLLRQLDSLGVDSLTKVYLHHKDIPIYHGNQMKLLPSAQQKFDNLFADLRGAKAHIHLEYFNFRNDSISHALFNVLRERAKAGVAVRVLFDAFGNMSNDRPLKNKTLDSLRTLGIEIVKFDPIRFPWVNHVETRDHRKLVIIDGRIAYIGGMNIADYYIKGLDKIGEWRDMHSRIEGRAVREVQEIFLRMWHKATGQTLSGASLYPPQTRVGEIELSIVDRSPKLQPDAIKDMYALAIAGAKQEINIVNPYFVPTKAIMSSLHYALRKGVKVNVMVSAKSDIPFTPEAMLYKLRRLSKKGVQVYLYEGGFHHAKVMTVDARIATVGSANLNSRSLRYDYESNVFAFDSLITAQLDSIYQQDKVRSIPLDDTYWKRRSLWKKFVGWFANLFTPFL